MLHSMEAVHRDIKPDNVILRGSEAVLIDFDAARFYKPEHESDTQILRSEEHTSELKSQR